MIKVFQLWDLIDIWGFCEDIMDIDNDKKDDNNKDNKVNKGISALGVDT